MTARATAHDTRKLYIVAVAATRTAVLAHDFVSAYRAFVADKFPWGTSRPGEAPSRVAPPARTECVIRLATDLEVEEFNAPRRRRAAKQEESMFDASEYEVAKGRVRL